MQNHTVVSREEWLAARIELWISLLKGVTKIVCRSQWPGCVVTINTRVLWLMIASIELTR